MLFVLAAQTNAALLTVTDEIGGTTLIFWYLSASNFLRILTIFFFFFLQLSGLADRMISNSRGEEGEAWGGIVSEI